jgi:hypothetical protein
LCFGLKIVISNCNSWALKPPNLMISSILQWDLNYKLIFYIIISQFWPEVWNIFLCVSTVIGSTFPTSTLVYATVYMSGFCVAILTLNSQRTLTKVWSLPVTRQYGQVG